MMLVLMVVFGILADKNLVEKIQKGRKIQKEQQQQCPCEFTPLEEKKEGEIRNESNLLCVDHHKSGLLSIHKSETYLMFLATLTNTTIGSFRVVLLNESYSLNDLPRECNVLLKLVSADRSNRHYRRSLCPGVCSPIPVIVAPIDWFISSINLFPRKNRKSELMLCSLDAMQLLAGQELQKYQQQADSSFELAKFVLAKLLWRRITECKEEKYWHYYYEYKKKRQENISRRKVESVVIWIGSISRHDLIEEQSQMLLGQAVTGPSAVVGWAATDAIYACQKESTTCAMGIRGNTQYRFLPQSAINFMSFGWRCAQG